MFEQLGLDNEQGVTSPVVSGNEEEDVEEDSELTGDDITRYQRVIARCNYLFVDCPDCISAIQEGCRQISKPTTNPNGE